MISNPMCHFAKRLTPLLVACMMLLISGCSTLTPNQPPTDQLTTNTQPISKASTEADASQAQTSSRFETKLANGLRIIAVEDTRAPVVMTQVWYKVGAVDEPDGKGGISHVLEHMMFKGTQKVTGDDFNRIVARFGGSQNAFTSYDYTGYYQLYPANRMNLALELEADRMQNLILREEDFVAERQVVMEERRQRTDDNPKALAYEQFRYMAFTKAAQAKPVIGKMSEIASISLGDLKSWYKKWYAPNNATLVVVGDVTHEEVFSQAKHYFGGLQPFDFRTNDATTWGVVREPTHTGARFKQLDIAVPVASMYMGFNVPSLTTATNQDDAYALALLQDILDGGLSARLETRLVREQKLLASVGTSYDLFTRGDGLFFISATPAEGVSLDAAKQAILAEVNALKKDTFTTQELERVKTNYITGLVYMQDDISAQARLTGMLATVGLPAGTLDSLTDNIERISTAKLHEVATRYFTENNLATLYMVPESTTDAPSVSNNSANDY